MKKEIAEKWVAALRSGKYKQTKTLLRKPDCSGYCCLGVLTDLYAIEKGISFERAAHSEKYSGCGLITKPVYDWSGFTNFNTASASDDSLAALNDGYAAVFYNKGSRTEEKLREAYDFNEIADHIEKNWETL